MPPEIKMKKYEKFIKFVQKELDKKENKPCLAY